MRYNQPRPGFEFVSPCPFPTTITITPRAYQSQSNTIHIHMQYKNTGGLYCFGYERFINFWLWFFDTRRETQFLKVFKNHTMLTPPERTAHLVMFEISIYLCRSRSENLNRRRNGGNPNSCLQRSNTQLHISTVKIQLTSFQNPQILRTISSWHDVNQTPVPFSARGFIITNGDCHILCVRA